jgi:hypothetical protein
MVSDIYVPALPEDCEELYSAEMADRLPTQKERLEKVEGALVTIQQALGLRPKTTWRGWLRERKGVIAVAATFLIAIGAVIVAYLAWWQPQWRHHADSDLEQQVNNQIDTALKQHHFDSLAGDVSTMKGQLTEVSGYIKILVESQIKRIGALTPGDFKNSLPEVKSVMGIAKVVQVSAPREVQKVRLALAHYHVDTPEYWEASSAMINYLSPPVPQGLPECANVDKLSIQAQRPDGSPGKIFSTDSIFDNGCFLDLDKHDRIVGFACDRCAVRYSGGPLTLSNVQFKNCIYLFSVKDTTPPIGKLLAREILAKEANDIYISPVN